MDIKDGQKPIQTVSSLYGPHAAFNVLFIRGYETESLLKYKTHEYVGGGRYDYVTRYRNGFSFGLFNE